ncbi:MAG TPA: HAMP domain-containing sensor histidine kinase [Solirubrobacteraceae bacterium]|jgi:two-component system OmpR family sensor kinase|nr:HAMP domain-containing sensor histidine kinase [Solirubrobacteraceae bacterium]
MLAPTMLGRAPRRLREIAGSLRWRLAAWVALVVVASSAITFFAVYRGTGTQLRRQIDTAIKGDAGELRQALIAAGARSPGAALAAARAYVRGQPFNVSSTVLFVRVAGAGTATNTPELFGNHAPDDGESVAVQEQENRAARVLLVPHPGFSTPQLPDVGQLRLLERWLRLPGAGEARVPVTIGVGEPLASVARAQRGVARAFILAGLIALAAALLASLWIGSRFSRPLRRMAAVAAQVDGGGLSKVGRHPRIHHVEREAREVQVLADAFNHMLDRLTDAFAGQREFVADASHELRTPLTVIRGQLEVLAAQPHPSPAEVRRVERLAQAEIARISRLVDDLLVLAKAEQAQFLRPQPIDLQSFVPELWDGASLIAPRRFQLGDVPAGTLHADPDRLAQALRNLIANAIDHTDAPAGLVRLSAQAPGESPESPGGERFASESAADGRLRLVVEDDGPGIAPAQRERVFDRFHRTDAARDRASGGAGLGLAIVRAIAEAHGGTVRAGQSAEGGARIELELPRFTTTPRHIAVARSDRRAAAATAAGVTADPNPNH